MNTKQITFRPKAIDEKIVVKSQEVLQTFGAGEIIFSQGDQGGDLMFIESGSVEIFITKNSQEVPLAQMGEGEILGVMTFLTHDPRLASARATLDTQIKRIPSQHVQKYIASFPKWLNIVLKEFVGRINEMNRLYSEGALELKKARDLQITPLFLATQMAQALSVVSKGIAKSQNGIEFVLADEVNEKIQLVLNQPKEMVDSLFTVFEQAGLLKAELESERKRKVYQTSALEKAALFTQFVRESVQGSTRKIIKARLSYSELKIMKAAAKYCIKKGNSADKSAMVSIKDLTENLQKDLGTVLDADVFVKPAKVGLIVLKGDGDDASVILTPSTLLRTLACILAMRYLNGEQPDPEEDVQEAPTVLSAVDVAA